MQKRVKVKDTCDEISTYLTKIEKDKKVMMNEFKNGYGSTSSRSVKSSHRSSHSSPSNRELKKQISDYKRQREEGEMPSTKYVNRKRDMIRQLMKEKQTAIEKGVQERLQQMEVDMIHDME